MGNQSVSGAMILTAEKRLPSPVSPIYPYGEAPASRPAYGIGLRPGRRAAPFFLLEQWQRRAGRTAIAEAGMEFVTVYDAFTRKAPDENSERVYFIAREQGKHW